jgi:hypothetical protein
MTETQAEYVNGHDPETGELPTDSPNKAISEMALEAARSAREAAQSQWSDSTSTKKINLALLAAQMEIRDVVDADKEGNHKAKYATLSQLLRKCGPILRKYGVIIRQGSGRLFSRESNNISYQTMSVYTRLTHVPSGESIIEVMDIPFQKIDPNAAMSALKYGQRATLRSILGITDGEAEDDGAAASSHVTLDGDMSALNPIARQLIAEMRSLKDAATLKAWAIRNRETMATIPDDAAYQCRDEYQRLMREFENAPPAKAKKAAE